ncbi:helix-turn-helix domain-containing protein [Nocardioides sp. KR10-350]|uniref:helix-turn-helix domain-containing protein n=1 Tax=Nocardioides cheoyonin TaxID=3156615 RepID=UPI0032B427F9
MTTRPEAGNETEVDLVEVRRNTRLSAAVALAALLTAAAFCWRGGVVGYTVGALMLLVAVVQAWTAYDGRTPLMLVDEQGVRLRFGRAWRGIPWSGVDEVEHLPRRRTVAGWWRDGRLAVLLADEDEAVAELPAGARRHARLTQRLYGVPFAVPLGLGTRVVGDHGDLTAAIAALAGESVGVVEIDPSIVEQVPADAEPEPVDAEPEPTDAQPEPVEAEPEPTRPVAAREDTNPRINRPVTNPPPLVASPTPSPLREPTVAIRTELRWQPREDDRDDDETVVHGANALRLQPAEDASATQETELVAVLPEGVSAIATPGEPVEPLELEDFEAEPADDPVIGPELAAARTRLGLTVDTLAERTRIRPHVIESIEVDDFAPCGGDFYARGHLRTLARVLGVDAAPLLKEYDERYAAGPVDPRTVFEAELATGPTSTLRRMRGGPNWSVLVAAVMAVVLIWSVARLVMDGTGHPASTAMSLDSGSAGTTNPYGKAADPVPVTVTAAGGGAHVVIRDSRGRVVFTGDLAFGESRSFKVSPPLRIQTSDGSLSVSVDGGPAAALGKTGEAAQKTYTAR